jgi:AraC-like DNA-binding protein
MLRFSTDDFPQDKRVEAYREIFGRTIVKHDLEPIGDQPFHFEASLCSLPGLGLASSLISPCRRSHGPQHIDSDDLVLGVGLAGGCVVQQRGREAVIGAGEAVLTSCADPADVVIASASRSISLRIPYSILRPRIADVDACLSRRIPRSAEGLPLLAGYIGAILGAEELAKPGLRNLVVAHVYDLVSLILGPKDEARELAEQRGVPAARRSEILRAIENRCGDAGLSAATIAALLGVTPRYIHFLLEQTGRSFTHHVLDHRLERAAALLRDPQWRDRKIAHIATEAGFTDLSYFSRVFRRKYGATPSDMRAAASDACRE